MSQNQTTFTILLVILFTGIVGTLTKRVPVAAAYKECTTQPQAGIAQVSLGQDGVALVLVPLAVPFCTDYSVVANPPGSGAEFAVDKWFVDTHELNAFVIGAAGTPYTTVTFQWLAIPRTQ